MPLSREHLLRLLNVTDNSALCHVTYVAMPGLYSGSYDHISPNVPSSLPEPAVLDVLCRLHLIDLFSNLPWSYSGRHPLVLHEDVSDIPAKEAFRSRAIGESSCAGLAARVAWLLREELQRRGQYHPWPSVELDADAWVANLQGVELVLYRAASEHDPVRDEPSRRYDGLRDSEVLRTRLGSWAAVWQWVDDLVARVADPAARDEEREQERAAAWARVRELDDIDEMFAYMERWGDPPHEEEDDEDDATQESDAGQIYEALHAGDESDDADAPGQASHIPLPDSDPEDSYDSSDNDEDEEDDDDEENVDDENDDGNQDHQDHDPHDHDDEDNDLLFSVAISARPTRPPGPADFASQNALTNDITDQLDAQFDALGLARQARVHGDEFRLAARRGPGSYVRHRRRRSDTSSAFGEDELCDLIETLCLGEAGVGTNVVDEDVFDEDALSEGSGRDGGAEERPRTTFWDRIARIEQERLRRGARSDSDDDKDSYSTMYYSGE